jgi:3-deoxy-D-manno-octulosonic-acid transferase
MLYSIGFFIFSVFYLPVLIFKGKLHPDFAQRFARFDKMKERLLLSGKDRIWIQAVSVGEVALCKQLIPSVKKAFPDRDIVISTITRTGNDLAKKLFSKDVIVIYFPLDFLFIVRRAVDLIKPSLYIMVETEIWPNLLKELSRRNIRSVLINGRISNRSIGRYRLARPFLKKTLRSISAFCMQDDIDAARIKELGAESEKVSVTGNMKFDAAVSINIKDPKEVRVSLGLKEGDELFVAGSTHEGEESIVVEVFKKLSADFPRLRLLIAPRHVERTDRVEKTIADSGLASIRYSVLDRSQTTDDGGRILLLDVIGHLNEAYSVATIVFIGGSLVEHGGQNPIEPAYFGRPVMFGRYMFNFKYIAGVLLKNKAAMQVFSMEDMYEKSKLLLSDPGTRNLLARRARDVIDSNKGATDRNIKCMQRVIG